MPLRASRNPTASSSQLAGQLEKVTVVCIAPVLYPTMIERYFVH